MKPFFNIAEELIEACQECYQNAEEPLKLTTKRSFPPESTEIPSDPKLVVFARPKVAADLSRGFDRLDLNEDDTPASLGLKDNDVLAFTFLSEESEESDPQFQVTLVEDGLEVS